VLANFAVSPEDFLEILVVDFVVLTCIVAYMVVFVVGGVIGDVVDCAVGGGLGFAVTMGVADGDTAVVVAVGVGVGVGVVQCPVADAVGQGKFHPELACSRWNHQCCSKLYLTEE
jgi:hypothetical protein